MPNKNVAIPAVKNNTENFLKLIKYFIPTTSAIINISIPTPIDQSAAILFI